MSKRRVIEILSDIKKAISRIKKYVKYLNFDQFLKDFQKKSLDNNYSLIRCSLLMIKTIGLNGPFPLFNPC